MGGLLHSLTSLESLSASFCLLDNYLSVSRHTTALASAKMVFNTKLTRALGIKVPVVQGGMQWVGYAEMASAVSNAGGLGILTALTQPTPEDLRKEIRRCRTMTKNPFAVNITLLPTMNAPPYGEYAQVCIDEGIKIVETAGNSPGPVIKLLKKSGVIILHKCTTIRHAQSAVKLGVDFLSIDGFECAGHVGESDITNFIHVNIKQAIVDASEHDTELVLRRWRNTSRLFKNKVASEAVKIEKTSPTGKFEEVAPYVSGKRGREVFINGDKDFGVWTAGQVIGLIHDVPTCEQLLRRIEKEAFEAIERTRKCIQPQSKL